jgi:5,10-methylenetetrahydromethanopterin reductase
MNLSIGITTSASLEKVNWLASLSDEMSVYRIWVGEDIDSLHDVFTLVSIFLVKTKFTKVGIGITSPLIRNISTIARASAGLKELDHEERFTLGLGIGGLQDLAKKGLTADKPLEILKDATDLLRRILSGEKVTSSGRFNLDGYSAKCNFDIPIYFGARGPKLLELAGEIADGVIISGPRSYIERATSIVREGLKRRKLAKDFTIVVWVPTILIKDGKGMEMAREVVAVVVSDTPKRVLELCRIDEEKAQRVRGAVSKLGVKKASDLVDEELIRDFSILGHAREICEDFLSLERYGVGEVVFGPPYGLNWKDSIESIVREWRS